MSNYVVKPLRMTSASGEAGKNTYRVVQPKQGTLVWLVSCNEYPADNIYVEGGENSEGFGGREIDFELEDGFILTLKGPWHTNSESLYHATGLDIRNKHRTFVVIAKDRVYENNQCVLKDVLYQDKDWIESEFNRGEKLGKFLAKATNNIVYCYQQSAGGSSCGPIRPEI